MERTYIIILKQGDLYETWGSLKELCTMHDFPYWTLARLKFPFVYDNYEFIKVPFRRVAKKK
jgi:hypothetical protein